MIASRGRVTAVLLAVVAALLPAFAAASPARAVTQEPGTYVALSPARLLDTRSGTGVPRGAVARGGTVDLQVTGRGGVPASGVSAVLLNVTVTNPTGSGYVTAYPTGEARPTASNLNFVARQTVPNLVAVRVGTGGRVALYNGSGGTADLLADVAGYYVAGAAVRPGAFLSTSPTRLLDTRAGTGAPRAPVAASGTVRLQVTGDVVPAGVSAVLLNVTVTNAAGSGYVTAYPDGGTRPTASNLNFAARQTVPNLVAVKVGANGRVALYNGSSGNVDLLADVAGYYVGGTPVSDIGAFAALPPARILDTRVGTGAPAARVASGGTVTLSVTGRGGVPASNVAAVLLNVTVVKPSGSGYLTAYPAGAARPTASNLNFGAGAIIANLVAARVGTGGKVALYNGSGGTVDVLADVAGYVLAAPPDTTAPAPVTNVDIPAFTDHSVTLTWTNPTDADFTGVVIRRAFGPNPPATPTSGSFVADSAETTFTDTAVDSDTFYSYALFAHDAVPNYAVGAGSVAVLTGYAPVTNARATATTSSSITLAWTRSPDVAIERTVIRRTQGTTPPPTPNSGTLVTSTDASTFTDTGLTANTTYSYALFAADVEGRAAAPANVTARTAAPTPPNGIVASLGTVDWRKDSAYYGWYNWADPDVVRLYPAASGDVGVATYHPSSSTITVQAFDPLTHAQVGSTKTVALGNWPIWGGMYAAPTGDFYVAVGRENPDEDDDLNVVAIQRYDAAWNLLGTAYVTGGASQGIKGVYSPFEAGAAHMVLVGTKLVLHMSRLLYAIDGVHHQANLTVEVDVPTMTATPFQDLGDYTYSSHSFQQLVTTDGTSLVTLDHGDAYPRAIQMGVTPNYPTSRSTTDTDLLEFPGSIGDNFTGATLTGVASGPSGILAIGNSIRQDGAQGTNSEKRNVYVIAADPATGAHSLQWLTSFAPTGTSEALQPRVVQVGTDRFAVLFTVTVGSAVRTEYRLLDSAGTVRASATFTGFRFDAGTDPVEIGDAVYWAGRPSSGGTGAVYGLDVSDPTHPQLLGS